MNKIDQDWLENFFSQCHTAEFNRIINDAKKHNVLYFVGTVKQLGQFEDRHGINSSGCDAFDLARYNWIRNIDKPDQVGVYLDWKHAKQVDRSEEAYYDY